MFLLSTAKVIPFALQVVLVLVFFTLQHLTNFKQCGDNVRVMFFPPVLHFLLPKYGRNNGYLSLEQRPLRGNILLRNC